MAVMKPFGSAVRPLATDWANPVTAMTVNGHGQCLWAFHTAGKKRPPHGTALTEATALCDCDLTDVWGLTGGKTANGIAQSVWWLIYRLKDREIVLRFPPALRPVLRPTQPHFQLILSALFPGHSGRSVRLSSASSNADGKSPHTFSRHRASSRTGIGVT